MEYVSGSTIYKNMTILKFLLQLCWNAHLLSTDLKFIIFTQKKDFYPSAQVLLSRLCGRFQLYYHFASMEVMYYYPRLMKHCLSL